MSSKAQYRRKNVLGWKVTLEGKRVFVWPKSYDPADLYVGVAARIYVKEIPKHLVKRHHVTKEAALQDFEDVCNAVLMGVLPPSCDNRQVSKEFKDATAAN